MNKSSNFLDLRNTPCPLNVVKCKLALEKLSKTNYLLVDLDKGEPIDMVTNSLKSLGYKLIMIKEEKDWVRFKVTYVINKKL